MNLQDIFNLGYGSAEECDREIRYCHYGNQGDNIFKNNGVRCYNGECYFYYDFEVINTNYTESYRSCLTSSYSDDKNGAVQYLADMQDSAGCDLYMCDSFGNNVGLVSDYLDINIHHACVQSSQNTLTLYPSSKYKWLNYDGISFWTMETNEYLNGLYLYSYSPKNNTFVSNYKQIYKYAIRPVINLKKESSNIIYTVGNKITFGEGSDRDDYYVLADSMPGQEYVTVLKYTPLRESDIGKVKTKDSYAKVSFYEANSNCDSRENTSGCTANYNESNIKKIIQEWISENIKEEDLVEQKKQTFRLITIDELINDFGYVSIINSSINIQATENTPPWIYDTSMFYWAMPERDETELGTAGYDGYIPKRINEFVQDTFLLNRGEIRPVIYLNKCAFGDEQCKVCPHEFAKYKYVDVVAEYKVGDKVTYLGEEYYVVNDSDENSNVVTLLKAEPLTKKQLNKYYNNDDFYYEAPTDDGVSFHITNTCRDIDYTSNHTYSYNCNNSYNRSLVKSIVESWAQQELDEDDLVEIDGYKARLLTLDELKDNFNYEYVKYFNGSINKNAYKYTENTKDGAYLEGKRYWIIDGEDDDSEMGYYVGETVDVLTIYSQAQVRPVINVNKCSIDGGCVKGNVLVSCDIDYDKNSDEQPNNSTVVDVPSTLSLISSIIIFISLVFIISGTVILTINYKKYLKEKNKIK